MEELKELETRDMETRQTDEALAKTEQIQALMADIKELEVKATAKRAKPGDAALDLNKRCWPIDTFCWACSNVSGIYDMMPTSGSRGEQGGHAPSAC